MNNQIDKKEILVLSVVCAVMVILFGCLYASQRIKTEKPAVDEDYSLNDWTIEDSAQNNSGLEEDKSIYSDQPDNNIYDVYVSVFPTPDEDGKMIDFSSFGYHEPRNHDYNPTLNCNVQIVNEDEKLDPLLSLDKKNATIRVRGNSSRGDKYKSYKIKLNDKNDSFKGQTSLNVNKHSEDISKVTTKFCTDILQEMDNITSYRTTFMRVWIRDCSVPADEQEFEYYGLFTQTEQPNKTYLENRGLSSNCEMYKARDFSFRLTDVIKDVDDPEYSEHDFETVLGILEGDSHAQLIEMLEAVNDETRNFEEVFSTYFDEENYLTWLAFNILLGGTDILNHNFIIYSPNNSQKWYFLPWDFDSDLDKYDNALPPTLKGGQKLNQVILHRRYFRIPGNLEKLSQKIEELVNTYFTEEHIAEVTAGYKPVVSKTLGLEPDIELLNNDMTPADVIPYIDSFYDIIQKQHEEFRHAFNFPAPFFVSKPEKNTDGTLHLAWDPSYSYQQKTVKYRVEIATDCHMQNVIYESDDIINNYEDTSEKFDAGTYYLMVYAVDSDGHEQISLEHYEFMGAKFIYESGVLEFTVE